MHKSANLIRILLPLSHQSSFKELLPREPKAIAWVMGCTHYPDHLNFHLISETLTPEKPKRPGYRSPQMLIGF